MKTVSQQMSAAGVTPHLSLPADYLEYKGPLPPGIVVTLSAGASMTYNLEVTGDDDPSSKRPGKNWTPLSTATALTAGVALALPFAVSSVRANVTTYVSGTLNIAVVTP